MNRKQRRAAASTGKRGGGATGSADAHAFYLVAYEHHARGDLEGAKAYYLRALALEPEQAGSLLGMGLIAFASKMWTEAEDFLRGADASEPGDPTTLSNLAAVCLETKRYEDCIAFCQKVLALAPDNYEALTNLSFAQRKLRQFTAAIATARSAIKLAPDRANALVALGTALVEWPDKSDVDTDEALSSLLRARAIDPHADGKCDAGIAELLLDRGNWRGVIEFLTDKANCRGDDANRYRLLAMAHLAAQNYPSAGVAAREYCDLEPENGSAHSVLAAALLNLKEFDEALAAAKKAIELDPNLKSLNLDICQMRQLVADWDGLEEAQSQVVDFMLESEAIAGPFHLISMPEPAGSAANQLRCAQIYQKRISAANGLVSPLSSGKRLNEKLKIGYLSNDYRDHATASLICELIERHDRDQFEVVAYCYSADDGSGFRERLKQAFDTFQDVNPLAIDAAARLIHDDDIDILVDLKGYTQGSRSSILLHRPAPIQINYLGYPGTMGASFVDYIIGDEFLTPSRNAQFYSEKIVQLPHCYQPNDTQRAIDPFHIRREDYGLPFDAFVFCSFNNVNKLTRNVFQIWMRLLRDVPNSVLWLLTMTPQVKVNLRREAEACGIDAHRLVFAPIVSIPTHIARMRLADLFLDSFPCTAHTTASEALWAGLPMVSCAGETFASRVAGSILTAGGLPELITTNLGDYERLALRLAQTPDLLSAFRDRLQTVGETPLFDIGRYTRDLERAYLKMAALYREGQQPEAIVVRDLPDHPHFDQQSKSTPSAETPAMDILDLQRPANDRIEPEAKYIDARVNYNFCPICYSKDTTSLGASNVARHPLYKPQLPPTLPWCLCRSCTHVFAEGFYTEEAYTLLHPVTPLNERAGHDAERGRLASSKIVQRVSRIAPNGIWLDVGFGNGSMLFTAHEFGYHAVGLDIRSVNVKAMQAFGVEAHDLCIERYEPNRPCSVISMINLLQYVPFPGSAIEHAARLLKPNGVLFLILPNMDTEPWRMLDRDHKNPYWTDIEIYHHFTRERLYSLLVQHGLAPVEYVASERFRSSMEIVALKLPQDGR